MNGHASIEGRRGSERGLFDRIIFIAALLLPGMAHASGSPDATSDCTASGFDDPVFYAAIQRTYVLGEGLCGTPNPELIIIVGDRVEGPGFSCEAFSRVPGAGTGMEEFQVACMMDGQKVEGVLTLDLGNAADHFSLLLPRAGDWFSLYTCDNPHLLK